MFQGLPGPFKQKPLLAAYEVTTTVYCGWMSWRGMIECMERLFPSDFAAEAAQSRMYEPLKNTVVSRQSSYSHLIQGLLGWRRYEPTEGAVYANGVLGALVLFEMAMLLVLPELRSWDAVLHHFACCAVRSPAAQDPPVRSPVISQSCDTI